MPNHDTDGIETQAPTKNRGWFKAMRFAHWPELVRTNRAAFIVVFIVAYRSRWNETMNLTGLHFGEAFVDYQAWGLSRQEFRTGVRMLKKHGLLTSRSTSRGNAYRLTGTQLFEVLPCETNHPSNQPANHRSNQPANHKPRTERTDRTNNKEEGHAATRASVSGETPFEIPNLEAFYDYLVELNDAGHPVDEDWGRKIL